MAERQQNVLHLHPHMVPALRKSFKEALGAIHDALAGLQRQGYLSQPWLGDETSAEVATHYTKQSLEGPGSSYELLTAYRDELTRAHDTLQQMEDDYRRREGDNAALWGRTA